MSFLHQDEVSLARRSGGILFYIGDSISIGGCQSASSCQKEFCRLQERRTASVQGTSLSIVYLQTFLIVTTVEASLHDSRILVADAALTEQEEDGG